MVRVDRCDTNLEARPLQSPDEVLPREQRQYQRSNEMVGRVTRPALMTLLLCCILPAHAAHDHGKNEAWFNGLKNAKSYPCCSNADGTAVVDADWESKGGKYRVRIKGDWYMVPDYAVLPGPNLDGRTIVWPRRGALGLEIICFIPGEMT